MIVKQDVIYSRNNPQIKWVYKLKDKKERENERCFFVEGEKLVFEAIEKCLPLTRVYVMKSKLGYFLPRLERKMQTNAYNNCEVFIVKDDVFQKISTENSPQGILSVIKYLDFFNNLDIINREKLIKCHGERSIILSSLRDPGNLGAVIRSSVGFGVDHIYVSSDCADVYNSKTVRGAMGTIFNVKISIVSNLVDLVNEFRQSGRHVYAAELREGARDLNEIDLCSSDVFVIGNEGHGIPEDVSEACDASVYIPIASNTESLNASVAAAVIMWEQSKLK